MHIHSRRHQQGAGAEHAARARLRPATCGAPEGDGIEDTDPAEGGCDGEGEQADQVTRTSPHKLFHCFS